MRAAVDGRPFAAGAVPADRAGGEPAARPHDLAEAIRRLQAYEAAGADVLYAPGLRNLDEVRQVVGAVKRPFNVVTGWLDPDITAAQLAEAGAKRISVGGALSRLALATFVEAGRAMQEMASFAWMREMMPIAETRRMFAADRSPTPSC